MRLAKFFTLLLVASSLLSFSLFGNKEKAVTLSKGTIEKKGSYKTRYGNIALNNIVIIDKVNDKDYLSTIFLNHGLSTQLANEVSNLKDYEFDVKKIRSGQNYAFVLGFENGEFSPKTFIYEKNRIEYYIIDLSEKVSVTKFRKPVEYVERVSEGLITSSLYETMIQGGANPLLAISMSEIYAWTIDFYRIQKNDYFKVVYMEGFVEGESVGAFKILASQFTHFGKDRFAYYFEEECKASAGNYYDEEGNSMKRAFLKAPVKYSRISSKYSNARLHPVTKVMKAHLGTDYAAPEGTPIYSTANGTVEAATYNKGNGNYVKIKHNSTYSTQYLHMSKIAAGIKPGVYVQQGQVIGYVGSTGLATGPHVCYRFWKNGKQVDPYKEDLPEYESLEGAKLEAFKSSIQELKNKLQPQNLEL